MHCRPVTLQKSCQAQHDPNTSFAMLPCLCSCPPIRPTHLHTMNAHHIAHEHVHIPAVLLHTRPRRRLLLTRIWVRGQSSRSRCSALGWSHSQRSCLQSSSSAAKSVSQAQPPPQPLLQPPRQPLPNWGLSSEQPAPPLTKPAAQRLAQVLAGSILRVCLPQQLHQHQVGWWQAQQPAAGRVRAFWWARRRALRSKPSRRRRRWSARRKRRPSWQRCPQRCCLQVCGSVCVCACACVITYLVGPIRTGVRACVRKSVCVCKCAHVCVSVHVCAR